MKIIQWNKRIYNANENLSNANEKRSNIATFWHAIEYFLKELVVSAVGSKFTEELRTHLDKYPQLQEAAYCLKYKYGEKDYCSLLHLAANYGCQEIVEFLVKLGLDLAETTTNREQTVLGLAAGKGHSDVVSYLLDTPSTDDILSLGWDAPSLEPVVTSGLQGSVNVNRDALLLGPHFCHTCSLCRVELVVQFPARGSIQVLLSPFPGVLLLWHFLYSVGPQPVSSLHTYPLLCRGHSWRVRLAKQEALTPPGHLVSPLVCRGPWMSTLVLYCYCHSDSAPVLLYFTLVLIRLSWQELVDP